ncbi:MAG: hypothetical protein IJH34_00020 [Romboutsia sp.]|nr:hypothetical protein [Romboutsia sp.]
MKTQFIDALENFKNNLDSFEDDIFDDMNDIEQELNKQALNYKGEEDIIGLDDLMGPSYGSDVNESAVEVENRGGLRYIGATRF